MLPGNSKKILSQHGFRDSGNDQCDTLLARTPLVPFWLATVAKGFKLISGIRSDARQSSSIFVSSVNAWRAFVFSTGDKDKDRAHEEAFENERGALFF